MRAVASCSFGKDSIATVLLAKRHGEPLDEVVYCEVMFAAAVSGEVPEHRDFIYRTERLSDIDAAFRAEDEAMPGAA